jgi:uncharacterized protein YjbI with pentapeptide repeats
MANPEHVKVVRQGAAAIAEWRRQNPGVPFDLTRADLRGAKLSEASLSGANLSTADLASADLGRADLTDALLTDANLTKAYLSDASLLLAKLQGANLAGAWAGGASWSEADLSGASLTNAILSSGDLTEVDLTGADLRGARLFSSHLFGADLTGANLYSTCLAGCDLSQAKGLSTVQHEGPSSIGMDTLINSFRGTGNNLTPELQAFFLGAGVPRELLAALPQIVHAVEFYTCFIAYGQPDEDFAKRLCDDLEARGVSCWFYDLDATPGERTWAEIGRERGQADKMVVVCSAAALIRDGVLKEIEEQIDENPDKMIPISRDNLWTEAGFRVVRGTRDLKPFLLDKNYADFSDESCYEESLQRLLKALRRKAD